MAAPLACAVQHGKGVFNQTLQHDAHFKGASLWPAIAREIVALLRPYSTPAKSIVANRVRAATTRSLRSIKSCPVFSIATIEPPNAA